MMSAPKHRKPYICIFAITHGLQGLHKALCVIGGFAFVRGCEDDEGAVGGDGSFDGVKGNYTGDESFGRGFASDALCEVLTCSGVTSIRQIKRHAIHQAQIRYGFLPRWQSHTSRRRRRGRSVCEQGRSIRTRDGTNAEVEGFDGEGIFVGELISGVVVDKVELLEEGGYDYESFLPGERSGVDCKYWVGAPE